MKKVTLLIAALLFLAFAGRKLTVYTGTTSTEFIVADIDSMKFSGGSNITPNDTSKSVLLDDFEINHPLNNPQLGDINFTNQSSLGYHAGWYARPDSTEIGGGYWYSYASSDGATVTTFAPDGSSDTIISGTATDIPIGAEGKRLMTKMFGDGKFTFTLDHTNSTSSSPYSGVGVFLTANALHLPGASVRRTKFDWDIDSVDMVTWNLSNLTAISLEGEMIGDAQVLISGISASRKSYEENVPMKGGKTELTPLKKTINVADIPQWKKFKDGVYSIVISMNGETTETLTVKLNHIKLHFATVDDKHSAFPFLKAKK